MNTLRRASLLSALALAVGFAAPAAADQMDETEGECIPTGLDGQLCALSQEVASEWRDNNWVQVGQDTWINETNGETSHWNEIAPDEYEILDPVEQIEQEGMQLDLEPGGDPENAPGGCHIDIPSGEQHRGDADPTQTPEITFEYPSGDSESLGTITAEDASAAVRLGPYGFVRMVVKAPTGAQLEEFEFVWAVYKAKLRSRRFWNPDKMTGVCISISGGCPDQDHTAEVALEAAMSDGYLSQVEFATLEMQSYDAFKEAVELMELAIDDTREVLETNIYDRARVESYIEQLRALVGPRPPEGPLQAFRNDVGPLVVASFADAVSALAHSKGQMTWQQAHAIAMAPIYAAYTAARGAPYAGEAADAELGFSQPGVFWPAVGP
jgi:hypothetical protein